MNNTSSNTPLNLNEMLESKTWEIREKSIPLPGGPGSSDGYTRVLFIGTTGAGKTTIVRQLLGTDPKTEQFPSTSAGKTTICDIEVILQPEKFKAVVTFMPQNLVKQYIEDCVLYAILAGAENKSNVEIIRHLLEHKEQRFRLKYILGDLNNLGGSVLGDSDDDDDDDDDDEVDDKNEGGEANIGVSDDGKRSKLLENIIFYFNSIIDLAKDAQKTKRDIVETLGIDMKKISKEDYECVQSLLEDEIVNSDKFKQVVYKILKDIHDRFTLLTDGEVTRGEDYWPTKWSYQGNSREKFIKLINVFSSNDARYYGYLLTPLVDGIRVSGPFMPKWHTGTIPKLVIMDGQGIGHVASAHSSISTDVTRRFHIVDKIVLVDNAAQPMLAAPCTALESLVISGNESKLLIAFTHFETVRGASFSGKKAKQDHVIASYGNAISAIGEKLGRESEFVLDKLISEERIFFLKNVHKKIEIQKSSEIRRFLYALDASSILTQEDIDTQEDKQKTQESKKQESETPIVEPLPDKYIPIYKMSDFTKYIQSATREFHHTWKCILGMEYSPDIDKEHWTRVKALSRRLAVFQINEYGNLRPVADMIRFLQVYISKYIQSPSSWYPSMPKENDEKCIRVIDSIKNSIFVKLHILSNHRILTERQQQWMTAYLYSGTGSTRERADEIVDIYKKSTPIPLETSLSEHFLSELEKIVISSIQESGGEVQ